MAKQHTLFRKGLWLDPGTQTWGKDKPASTAPAPAPKSSAPRRGRITERGIEPLARLKVQNKTVYYIGASSSPDRIVTTSVEADRVTFRRHPFAPAATQTMERWIFEDLADQGTRRQIASLEAWHTRYTAVPVPDWVDEELTRLRKALEGRKQKPFDVRTLEPVQVVAEVSGATSDDAWRHGDYYGNVSGLSDFAGGCMLLQIDTQKGIVPKMRRDKRVKVRSVTVRER